MGKEKKERNKQRTQKERTKD